MYVPTLCTYLMYVPMYVHKVQRQGMGQVAPARIEPSHAAGAEEEGNIQYYGRPTVCRPNHPDTISTPISGFPIQILLPHTL
jgi:hypothetical protein